MESVLQTTLLSLHLVIVIGLVGIILLQPSEGGGLGMGSGDGMSSFMTGRAKANFFTRTTAILATAFFITTLLIGIVSGQGQNKDTLILDAQSPAVVNTGEIPAVGETPDIVGEPLISAPLESGDVPAIQD